MDFVCHYPSVSLTSLALQVVLPIRSHLTTFIATRSLTMMYPFLLSSVMAIPEC